MGSNLDLRKYQEENQIQDAFSKLVSNRPGYKAPIEKREPKFCTNSECGKEIEHHVKFCDKCGTKVEEKKKSSICMKCYTALGPEAQFCTNCGDKLVE